MTSMLRGNPGILNKIFYSLVCSRQAVGMWAVLTWSNTRKSHTYVIFMP